MKPTTTDTTVLPSWLCRWEQFWFTPADPTVLALIRILCGLIVVYTLLAYSFSLQAFMGEHGWHNLAFRLKLIRERPVPSGTLDWGEVEPLLPPKTKFETDYLIAYFDRWKTAPPAPYPEDEDWDQVKFLDDYRARFNFDLRKLGLKPPPTELDKEYALKYTLKYGVPPPAYPKTDEEDMAIEQYMRYWNGHDPRLIYTKGMPITSLWFHVTDPIAMAVIHGLFTLCAFLLTIGFCTRFTAALSWFATMCYVQRNPTILFGVDTMTMILLLYLMIGPSGAAFSVDRLIARWWHTAKPGVIQAWCRFWRQPIPRVDEIAPSAWSETVGPSVAANVAIRLLQIHVCFIYFVSGVSKLLGHTWWNGSALWFVLGNYQMAPMQYEAYLAFLRLLASNQLVYGIFTTCGGLFTLAFEISYPYLVWRPKVRWVILGSAILLHGGIGLFLGLKTFSLIMLVMNMAFLRKEEALWGMRRIGLIRSEPVVAAGASKSK